MYLRCIKYTFHNSLLVALTLMVLETTEEAKREREHRSIWKKKVASFQFTNSLLFVARCVDNYTGARCEAVLLPSIKSHSRGELFVAVLASVVVLSFLVAGAIFFLCR